MRNAKGIVTLGRMLLVASIMTGLGSSASAGFVGFDIVPPHPSPMGSLDVMKDGSIVATNITVPFTFGVPSGASGTTGTPSASSITGYLDFSTGHPLGAPVNGVTTYSPSDANFFILGGVLSDKQHGATTPPLAMSVNMSTTVTSSSTSPGVYVLTAALNSAYLSPQIASNYGMISEFGFTGLFTLTFAFNSPMAGNQCDGGSLTLNPPSPAGITNNDAVVPAPPSLVLSALGALCASGGSLSRRFRFRFRRGSTTV